jgi:hypothetical protein
MKPLCVSFYFNLERLSGPAHSSALTWEGSMDLAFLALGAVVFILFGAYATLLKRV